MLLISVDGGTTNTRLVLIRDGRVAGDGRASVGLRDGSDGRQNVYSAALSEGIRKLLSENRQTCKDVYAVVLSGMICSEHGLCEVPHITSPVTPQMLAAAMQRRSFPGIADIPFYLVPGIKSFTEADDVSMMDVMRGEETELLGIKEQLNPEGGFTAVLPGSHCKIIPVGAGGEINGFSSTISGELIRAAAENTILRDGIRGAYPGKLNEKRLLEGYDYAGEHGLTEAVFKVRILQRYRGYTPDELFAVLCGAILSEDIRSILKRSTGRVLVGGSDPYRTALLVLLKNRTQLEAEGIPDAVARYAVAYGAEKLIKLGEKPLISRQGC